MNRLRRSWIGLILQGALALTACSDDDDDDDDDGPRVDAGSDAGRDAGPSDAGADASTGPRVSNVLATCSTDSMCTGSMPDCMQSLPVGPTGAVVNFPYPGTGACTAVCTAGNQCGTGGACPIGEAIALSPAMAGPTLGTTGYCSRSCTLGSATSCPTGYGCLNLIILGNMRAPGGDAGLFNIPPLNTPFCYPLPPTDAGTFSARISGGMDAGL